MSIYSNRSARAAEEAPRYIEAVLALMEGRDPQEILASTVPWCREQTRALTAEQLATPEREGKWSIAALLQHLADSEWVWGMRLRQVLAEDRPRLGGFDQDRWAERLKYDEADAGEALHLFAVLRRANLGLLERASPEELARVGIHSERGEESLLHMMRLYAGHDLVHRKQLERIAARWL